MTKSDIEKSKILANQIRSFKSPQGQAEKIEEIDRMILSETKLRDEKRALMRDFSEHVTNLSRLFSRRNALEQEPRTALEKLKDELHKLNGPEISFSVEVLGSKIKELERRRDLKILNKLRDNISEGTKVVILCNFQAISDTIGLFISTSRAIRDSVDQGLDHIIRLREEALKNADKDFVLVKSEIPSSQLGDYLNLLPSGLDQSQNNPSITIQEAKAIGDLNFVKQLSAKAKTIAQELQK